MRPWFLRGWQFRPSRHSPHGFGRLGALVDGVFAIVATLLVLDLRLPEEIEPGKLPTLLAHLGAQYAAYAIGFLQVVGGWLLNRRLDAWLQCVDHYATLLILTSLGIFALTPFTTTTLARSFSDGKNLTTAVQLTLGLMFVAAVLWSLLLVYARRIGLFRDGIDPDGFRLYYRNSMLLAWLVFPLAWLLTFASPWAGLVMLVALFLLTLLPLEVHPSPLGVAAAVSTRPDQPLPVADRADLSDSGPANGGPPSGARAAR